MSPAETRTPGNNYIWPPLQVFWVKELFVEKRSNGCNKLAKEDRAPGVIKKERPIYIIYNF